MILHTKLVIGLLSLTVLGAGATVAIHDGALATNVADLTREDLDQEVTVRGIVAKEGELGFPGSVQTSMGGSTLNFFVVRSEDSRAWFVVTTAGEPPAPGETAVVSGVLKVFVDAGASVTAAGMGLPEGATRGGWIDGADVRVSWTL